MNTQLPPAAGRYILIWAIQLALVFVSLASAFSLTPAAAVWVTLASAGAQGLLGLLFFMHLKEATVLIRIYAAVGFVWLMLMFGLTLADYLTRHQVPAPW